MAEYRKDKYYWFKLKDDFFKRHDIRIIKSMPNGKDYVIFYLQLLCESLSHNGKLRFNEEVPYNEEMLSIITDTNIDVVRSAMKIFIKLNLIEIMDDQTIYMTKLQNMVGSTTLGAEKKKLQRSRQQLELSQGGQKVDKCPPEIEKEIEKDIDKKETISKDIVKKKNATNVATLTKRKDDFYNSLIPFLEKYDKEMVREFFDYWTETNRSESKMRFELEKTWDTARRLATWAKNENKFSNGQKFNSTSNYESATDKRRREQQEYASRLANELQQKYGS